MARSLPRNACSSLRRGCLRIQLHLLLAALVVILTMTAGCEALGQCKVDTCTRLYGDAMANNGITDPERSAAFCRVLREYGQCIRTTARSCRGNLNYHSTLSLVHHVTAEYNCSHLLAAAAAVGGGDKTAAGTLPEPRSSVAPPTVEPVTSGTDATLRHHHKQCVFQGRHKFRHCGLFGDPHLKTFDNAYQTCRVRGAWPLIDNPYLAVQVTNEPVVDGSPATATTKVTIIIRGRATPCTSEKTYEAQADGLPLPTLFIDGTQRSGPDESVSLTVHDAGSRIEIHLRYIETMLVVRQVGRYLAFSARMPEELVQTRAYGQDLTTDSLQLCVRGCPPSERLDPVAARGHALPWLAAVARCRKSDGYSNDINNNLTDHYLDWCVFDVMTTGDGAAADDFTAAAHSAQADALRLDPTSLRNRTTTPEHAQDVKSGAIKPGQRLDWRTLAAVVLVVLTTLQRV